jgi:cytochrome d ubiquinol oxidase subunit II
MDSLAYGLPLIWAAILATAVTLYVILDGFGLGLGILFHFERRESQRDVIMNTIAPFWDGNQTWLVLGGGGLLAAFPKAYGLVMSGLYIPIIVMLLALVFRGVAFEFRWVANPARNSGTSHSRGGRSSQHSHKVSYSADCCRAFPHRTGSTPAARSTG